MRTQSSLNHFYRGVIAFCLILFSTLFTSCGNSGNGSKVVSDIQLSAYTEEGDIYAEFSALLDLGNITLPTIQFPVIHPDSNEWLGEINLAATMGGDNELGLVVNLSNATGLQGQTGAKLPNGMNIPVGGLGDAEIVQLPVSGGKAQVYIAMDSGVAMVGVAVPIKGLDSLGSSVGTTGFFPTFSIEGVRGIAGIFTGSSGQNGIALFVDLSAVIDPENFIPQSELALKSTQMATSAVLKSMDKDSKLFFIDQQPSKRKKRRLQKKLYKLHKRRTKLKL